MDFPNGPSVITRVLKRRGGRQERQSQKDAVCERLGQIVLALKLQAMGRGVHAAARICGKQVPASSLGSPERNAALLTHGF